MFGRSLSLDPDTVKILKVRIQNEVHSWIFAFGDGWLRVD